MNGNNGSAFYHAIYFDNFGIEHIPNKKVIKKFIENKTIITNIYKIQACDWIMCGTLVLDLLTL